MLHERIRNQNEIAGKPTAERDRDRGAKCPRGPSRFSPQINAPTNALSRKEREHSFHRERLSDHAAGILRKVSPIRSELKFHRNAGDDPDGKIESENLGPKPNSLIVFFVTGPERAPFPVTRNLRQPPIVSCGNKIVIDQRESEL
jgi:hypothetical protein